MRCRGNLRSVRLPKIVQLLATVAAKALETDNAQGRQDPLNPVQKGSSLADQVLPLAMSAPRLLVCLARNGNHPTAPAARRATMRAAFATASRHRSGPSSPVAPDGPPAGSTPASRGLRSPAAEGNAQPKTIPTRFMRHDNPRDRSPGRRHSPSASRVTFQELGRSALRRVACTSSTQATGRRKPISSNSAPKPRSSCSRNRERRSRMQPLDQSFGVSSGNPFGSSKQPKDTSALARPHRVFGRLG